MSSKNFLDIETDPLDSTLRVVHNELEDNLKAMFGDAKEDTKLQNSRPYKIIKPDPGFCVKAFRQTNNEKCFINICTSDGIPSPEDITDVQLTVILSSETPSNYKVPMSITELRLTPDKSGKDAIVCDVAIHPDFFRKVEALTIFRDFLITIIFEALDTKYAIQINRDSWIILKNRKSMGVLVKHRVQNRDILKVCDSYQNPTKDQKTLMNELKIDSSESNGNALISEIDPKTAKIVEESKKKDEPTKKVSKNFVDVCMTKTFIGYKWGCAMVEFLLPNVTSPDEINLQLGRDEILLEVGCAEYYFEGLLPFRTDVGKATSEFDRLNHVLTVKIPLCPDLERLSDEDT